MLSSSEATRQLAEEGSRATLAASILKALGHPIRLRIVATLCAGKAHVGALAEALDIPQVIVSQQLRILRTHGLVDSTRGQGRVYYRLALSGLTRLIRCIQYCSEHCAPTKRGAKE